MLADGNSVVNENIFENRFRYVDELRKMGADIQVKADQTSARIHGVPSVKGADSVAVGLDILRRYAIHFTRRSQGIIGNAKSYQWKRDRDGKNTNDPQDGNDHGIDAIRYVALMKLNQRRQTGGSRAKVMSF